MPLLATRPLSARVKPGTLQAASAPVIPNGLDGLRVALFPGCMTDRLFPGRSGDYYYSYPGVSLGVGIGSGGHFGLGGGLRF